MNAYTPGAVIKIKPICATDKVGNYKKLVVGYQFTSSDLLAVNR